MCHVLSHHRRGGHTLHTTTQAPATAAPTTAPVVQTDSPVVQATMDPTAAVTMTATSAPDSREGVESSPAPSPATANPVSEAGSDKSVKG